MQREGLAEECSKPGHQGIRMGEEGGGAATGAISGVPRETQGRAQERRRAHQCLGCQLPQGTVREKKG